MSQNIEDKLNAVADAISNCTEFDVGHWCIVYHENKFKCLPARSVIDDGQILGRISRRDRERGLTIDQWNAIAKKIADHPKLKG